MDTDSTLGGDSPASSQEEVRSKPRRTQSPSVRHRDVKEDAVETGSHEVFPKQDDVATSIAVNSKWTRVRR
ncbi:hypothetical protein [Methylobacter sp.]|uniref:hypothetical protein n=1 Tax=Methylobacter sp. TaxID=2051955 RepID=UPI0025F76B06|nr:hypothetical protein [Methylobacter sp.]